MVCKCTQFPAPDPRASHKISCRQPFPTEATTCLLNFDARVPAGMSAYQPACTSPAILTWFRHRKKSAKAPDNKNSLFSLTTVPQRHCSTKGAIPPDHDRHQASPLARTTAISTIDCCCYETIQDCGIELDSCTLTDLCDYTPADGEDNDDDAALRTSATGDVEGSSGAAGSSVGSSGGCMFRAAATVIGLMAAILGTLT